MGGCAPPATPVPSQVPTSTPAPAPELPEPSVVSGKQGVDMSSYGKIELDADHIEVSSTHKDWGKEHLLKEAGSWHVPVPKETNEAWVMVDLESQRQLDALTIKPRPDLLEHLWQGDAAILEGSNDKQIWTAEVRLELNHDQLNDTDWITFVLPEDIGSYRYYRLFIYDPGFISMAGLYLCGEGGVVGQFPTPTPPDLAVASGRHDVDLMGRARIIPNVFNVRVSSRRKPHYQYKLFREAGFWHVKVPKETNEAWVRIDLESQRQLGALAVKPRPGLLSQLWNGDTAVLEGSDDKQTWTALVILELDHDELNDQDWINFVLPEDIGAYRYFRLFIYDPGFFSMAGLRLYK